MKKYLLLTVLCLFGALMVCLAQEPAPGTAPTEGSPVGTADKEPAPATAGEKPVTPPEPAPLTMKQVMDKPFTVKLVKGIDIREFLRSLAKIGPLNIVTTRSVTGQVTYFIENATIGDVLEIVLITNGLAKEIRGDIIHIMTEAEYLNLYGKSYNSRLVVKTYQMEYVLPKRVANFLEQIKSKTVGSQILPDDGTRTLLIIEVQDKIKEMEEIIKLLDVPPETLTFELNNAKVDEIYTKIDAIKTPNFGEIQMDKRTKRFIVTDHASVLEKVARLIHDFDGKPRQVLIEAKVIQIGLTDEFAMGVKWEQVFSQYSAFKNVNLVGNFPVQGDLAKKTNLTATFGTLTSTHYSYVLQALKALGENKLISAPRLITLSDNKAEFHIGNKIQYYTTSQTPAATGTTPGTVETPAYIDEGVTISVTPSVNPDKYITMEITPSIKKVTEWRVTGQGNPYPAVIEDANTTTNVIVKDGVTIVIAGLIKDEKRKDSAGIPFVSQLPIVGPLLSSKREYMVKTETVIFLTPHIISGDADSSVITKQYDLDKKQPKELKPIR
ncbi:MAG: secretin N-terminal domain-containing protein [Planctomycetota bacterium]